MENVNNNNSQELSYSQRAFVRFEKYVKSLKHGSSFRYVKGISPEHKTLLNILYSRGLNGETQITLSAREAEAFNMGKQSIIVCADMLVLRHGACIMPLKVIE